MTFGPIVGADWLAEHLDRESLRIADCRWYLDDPLAGRAAYADGHIPGAVFVSLDDDLSAAEGPGRHPLPTRETFAQTLGRLGIGNGSVVVAYDDAGGAIAARLWWMMRWMGHRNVAVLDGGIPAWEAAQLPITALLPSHPSTRYEVGGETMPSIDRDELVARLGGVTLMDARDHARYTGEREPVDPVAGHIPTALNAPYAGNLGRDRKLLDPATLRERYSRLGAADGTETVVYCGSGVTACHTILAMEIAGLPPGVLYPGSWSDWSADPATPKATGA